MNLNNIYQGDCIELIKQLPENSIDLVVTSPPYVDVKSYGKEINILHPDNYVDWILPLFHGMFRALKPSGSIIFNIGDKTQKKQKHLFIFDLVCCVARETGLQYYDRYFWHQVRIPNGSPKRLNNFTEYIFHFTKDVNKVKWNMDDVREEYADISVKRYKSKMNEYEVLDDGTKIRKRQVMKKLNPKGKTPDGLFRFPNNSKSKGNKHPAPFSVDLPIWFIKALSDKGDTVLDPFMGSGTTAEAAIQLDRNWLGFELNDVYVEMTNKRININTESDFF